MKLLSTFILTFLIVSLAVRSVSASDTYPYPNSTCGATDPWSFAYRNCTSYAAWKANEAGVNFTNGMEGPNGTIGWFSHAGN